MIKRSSGAMEPRRTPNQPVGAAQRSHLSWDPIEDEEFGRWTTKGTEGRSKSMCKDSGVLVWPGGHVRPEWRGGWHRLRDSQEKA